MKAGLTLLFALLLVGLCACAPKGPEVLKVMTHDSFAASKQVIKEFESANQVTVQFIPSGDAGTALNKAILSKGNPIADVFYGVDNTFLSRALSEDVFEPYDSPLLAKIPKSYQLDPQKRLLPVDYGDVCLNYDIAYFKEKGLEPPRNLQDLTRPEFKGLLVVENPATSSPGLAFLLATIGRFGMDGYQAYWQALVANDVLAVNDWESAYNTEFSAHGGVRPIVVSYGSSPPAEVIFADPPIQEPPIAVITDDRSCFRQIEFVGILRGTKQSALAQKWIDFMLSVQFQEDMPLQMFVFPINPEATLPDPFARYAVIPSETAQVSPDEIAANRDLWLKEWTDLVLR